MMDCKFDEDVIPPDKSRINGWSYPPHPQQIIAWVFLIMFIVIYFWVMVPALPEEWQLLAFVINGIIIGIHLIVHIISLSMDPADYNVRHKKQHGPMPKFDRSKHAHVIENEHCYLCQVDVGNKSKHCRACNKCVAGFDHHCKWLNNCVGSRNYKLFLGSVSTAFLASLIIFICSLFFINAYFFAKSLLQPYRDLQIKLALENISLKSSDSVIGNNQQENQILETKNVTNEELGRSNSNITYWLSVFVLVPDKAWLGVIGTTGALALVAAGLLGHLFCFHVYLMCKNMSTYDYVILLRERAAAKTEDLEDSAFSKTKKPKNNKISPADKEESVEMENKIKKEQQVFKVITMEAEITGETPPPPPLSNLDKPKMGRKIQKKKKKRRKKIIIGENISSITALNAANVSPIATIAVSSLYPNRTYSLIPKDYRKPIHAGSKKQKEQLPSDDSDSSIGRQDIASFNKRNPSLTNLYTSGSKQNLNTSLYSLPPLQPGQQPPRNCGVLTQVDTIFYPNHYYPSEHNFVHRTTFHTNDRPLLLPVHNFQPSDFTGSVPGLKNFDINSQCSSTGSIYYTAVDTPLISAVSRSSGDGLTYGLVDPSPTLSDIGGLCLTKTCAPTPYNKYYY